MFTHLYSMRVKSNESISTSYSESHRDFLSKEVQQIRVKLYAYHVVLDT